MIKREKMFSKWGLYFTDFINELNLHFEKNWHEF
jgi:hypothetical protein